MFWNVKRGQAVNASAEINRKHEMFWNDFIFISIYLFQGLTVNMKCFEIDMRINIHCSRYILTVNMKCFEIAIERFDIKKVDINRKHEMFWNSSDFTIT